MGHTACTEPQCLYSTAIPLLPYGPYGLYSTAIPLLPLRAVRLVQGLGACTVELYIYSPYGPYGLYRAKVPVQGCTLPYLYFNEIGFEAKVWCKKYEQKCL